MMSTTVEISIIILYKKKDKKFYRAVQSAQFATEIILIENQEINDYARVRQQALGKATQDWVFFLDSDEIITPASINKIEKVMRDNIFDGIVIKRQDVFYQHLINFGEAGKTRLLRMGKKNKMFWERPVHEVAKIQGRVGLSDVTIIHYAHDSLNDFIDSITNYALLEAKFRAKQQQSVNILKLIIFPIGKFIYNFFIKRGYKDGWPGFSYAFMMSLHSFSVRVFQYEDATSK